MPKSMVDEWAKRKNTMVQLSVAFLGQGAKWKGRHFSRTLIHSLGLLKSVSYGGRERCRWPTDQGGELPAIVE
jgi:hypothetical protein